jgi:hypothetical protein
MRTRTISLVATLASTISLTACSSTGSAGPPNPDANVESWPDAASSDASFGEDGGTTGDSGSSDAAAASGGAYTWKNVVIGGGGWVTGLVRDATSGDLYARADVGGLYRWDMDHWTPLLEKFPFADANEYGVESVALSPKYATDHTLYFAAGKYAYAAHDLFKSTDRGQTWTPSQLAVPMVANLDDRWCGERLTVDPNNASVVYLGSPNAGDASAAGLWASTTSSSPGSWARVSSFPVTGNDSEGVAFVAFDPATTTTVGGSVRSSTMYVGVVDMTGSTGGVYRSTDAGATWARLTGSSQHSPCRGVVASDGTLYVSFRANTTGAGGVARIARGGSSLTEVDIAGAPSDAGYYAIAVDPSDPTTVYTTQSEGAITRPHVMYVTHDSGSSWSSLPYATPLPSTIAITQNQYTWFAGPAAMVINPSNVNEAWLTDGFGIMHTTNLTTSSTPTWDSQVTGIEEIVPDSLLSLPTGNIPLLSGSSDVGGFIHTSLTSPPTSRLPFDSEAISYDFCRSTPSIVVYTGHYYTSADEFAPFLAKSTDGGNTFQSMTLPSGGNGGGRIAIAPNDCNRWVLQQFDGSLWVTTDGAGSWTQVSGGPSVSTLSGSNIHNDTVYQQQLATDDVTGDFYIATVTPPTVSPLSGGSASVYRSADGVTWTKVATITFPSVSSTQAQNLSYDEINWHYNLRTTPGRQGDLWLAVRDVGIFHSTDGAQTFTQIPSVTSSGLLALGIAPMGSTTPTLFAHTVEGHFLRSDDLGTTFVSIDDPNDAVGDDPSIIEADRQVWGRVFVGTNGRGIYVGAVN